MQRSQFYMSPSMSIISLLILMMSACGTGSFYVQGLIAGNQPSQWMADSRKILESSQHILRPSMGDFQDLELESMPVVNRDALRGNQEYQGSSCELVQVIHLLYQSGCQPKAIASFACSGSCPSYVQVHGSSSLPHERSCSCCQQTGIQEAVFTLDCPSLNPPYRKVKTYAPIDCMCRNCDDIGKHNLQPYELREALASETGKLS